MEELCAYVNTEPSLPRLCGRQCRDNGPAQYPSDYFCCTICIPVLDHLLLEIKTRFGVHDLYIVPSLIVSKALEEVSGAG